MNQKITLNSTSSNNSSNDEESIAVKRISKLRIFSEQLYKNMHPDVAAANISPSWHAVNFGAIEGRTLFKREQIARVLGILSNLDEKALDHPELVLNSSEHAQAFTDFSKKYPKADIFVSSLGNIFMQELALDLAVVLKRAGVDVQVRDENYEVQLRSQLSIFVAPHEFFALGRGVIWMTEDVLRTSYVWNTEQMQTQWFAKSISSILSAKGVFDISPQAAQLFNNAEIPSMHLEPGAEIRNNWLIEKDIFHPLVRILPPEAKSLNFQVDSWDNRPIDISFFGSESPRRETFFSKNASFFAQYPSFIYYRRGRYGPIRARFDDQSLTRIAGHLSGVSKISLNVHRDEFSYFEWHRMVRQGMSSGALVVSDHCLPHPHLKPNVHFFHDELKHLPNLIDWLLKAEDGKEMAKK
ncbi:hypothetical protein [Candidatus Pantoea bituminis]|uniref:hypothetical protein n=1 Tax=Candidatus Pantoea bituminis TaxID=2831036 RepID=UPI001C062A54|nr:hypothetical protein [Pantoea bituminis]